MKTVLKIIFLCGIIVLSAFGCKDNKNLLIPENRLLEVKNLIYDGCKSVNDSVDDVNEYIELQTVDSNYLEVNHINVLFNCCPSIIIHARVEDRAIICNEIDTLPMCNCMCLFDINYKIGPLEYTQYSFELLRDYGKDAFKISLDFNQKTSLNIRLLTEN